MPNWETPRYWTNDRLEGSIILKVLHNMKVLRYRSNDRLEGSIILARF